MSMDASREIFQADFNPSDSSVVGITGDHCLKFFRIVDNNLKTLNITMMKREAQIYKCHSWLSDGKVLVGTSSGDVLVFDYTGNYELKISLSVQGGGIECMAPFAKGFVVGTEKGLLNIFEKSEDQKELFKCNKVFPIEGHELRVTCLSISPSEDTLACSTATNQIFVLSLSNTDILKPEDMNFEHLSTPFHSPNRNGFPKITGLDICVRKPLIVTCGLDCSVRVWNYIDKSIDIMKVFPWEAQAVALHPSGLQVAVGFTDKLQVMNLLMNDIRPFKEFSIKECTEIRFAKGGHLLAVANTQLIYIINTYTCQILYQLRGHTNAVSSVSFEFDDLALYSSGLSGNVCRWSIRNGEKLSDFMHKNFSWTSIICCPDNHAVYGVGEMSSTAVLEQVRDEDGVANGRAKYSIVCIEYNVDGTPTLKFEIDCGVKMGCIALSNSGKYLFAATHHPNTPSSIRAYKLPIVNNEYSEIIIHAAPITRMILCGDDSMMFTTSEDGSLALLNVKQEGRALKREKDVQFSEEILVTKSDLQEKQSSLQDLIKQVYIYLYIHILYFSVFFV